MYKSHGRGHALLSILNINVFHENTGFPVPYPFSIIGIDVYKGNTYYIFVNFQSFLFVYWLQPLAMAIATNCYVSVYLYCEHFV